MHFLTNLKKSSSWLIVFIGICLGSVIAFLLIPYIFDRLFAQHLLAELRFSEKELSLSRLTPWHIRGTAQLGNKNEPAISIPQFELQFRPTGLFDKTIEKLIIDSATIHLFEHDGKITMSGIHASPNSHPDQQTTPLPALPLGIETIILKHCLLSINMSDGGQNNFLINSQLRLKYTNSTTGKKLLDSLTGKLEISGELDAHVNFDIVHSSSDFILTSRALFPHLQQVTSLFPHLNNEALSGAVNLTSTITFAPSIGFTDINVSGDISNFKTSLFGIAFHGENRSTPITLMAQGDMEEILLSIEGLNYTADHGGNIAITGAVQPTQQRINIDSNISIEDINVAASLKVSGNWQHPHPRVQWALTSNPFTYEERLSISPINITGEMELLDKGLVARLDGHIQSISDVAHDVSAHNISFSAPFLYPINKKTPTKAGTFNIDHITYQGVEGGSFNAEFLQTVTGVFFDAQLSKLFNIEQTVVCNGNIETNTNAIVTCSLPFTNIDSTTLSDFFFFPDKLSFSGNISLDGSFSITDKIPSGQLTAEVNHGSLSYGETNLSDIQSAIHVPELPQLHSLPSQIMHIGKIDIGDVGFSNAELIFRIEDDQSLFLEKGEANWCGGKIETGGIRFHQEMEKLKATLYADRLGFSELMGQIGIKNTDGEGSLNGKIPLEIDKQGVVFNDGFLFSTPGNSGIIKFNDTEQLRQGIPELTSYLDYSMKALENFSYNWTKLTFNNQGSDLLIAMQLDGKPANPLPFGYKKGQIIPTTQGPGLQHPIRLDVNFRLPLQDLFPYGKNIQSIMENM